MSGPSDDKNIKSLENYAERPSSDQDAHQTLRDYLKRLKLTDWIVAIGTIVIAVATAWNVVVLKEGEKDTGRLSKATADLSAYAERQALMDRPWIGVYGVALNDYSANRAGQTSFAITPENITDASMAQMSIKNGGKFVAHLSSFKLNTKVFAIFPENPSYEDGHDNRPTVALPDLAISNSVRAYRPTSEEMADIRAGRKTYFIFAEIRYTELPATVKDSLGEVRSNKQADDIRTTHICFSYEPKMGGFQNCSTYNSAD
jgi:hypothetical protein